VYGLIAKLTLLPGKREERTALLAASSANMPGCFSCVAIPKVKPLVAQFKKIAEPEP
jgi:hypothetical protein